MADKTKMIECKECRQNHFCEDDNVSCCSNSCTD